MQNHTKVVGMLFLLGVALMTGYRFIEPMLNDSSQRQTSDARATKGKLVIGVDNWIGYFPLCSDEMRKRMRQSGYILKCVDDNANYEERMEKLENGEYPFAVATVDSYVLNGEKQDYPGTIVSVIDESKGGDAVVAWENKVKNLDALKANIDLKIAYTPNSPSEHLLKSMAVHFDVPYIRERKGSWKVDADGSEDALKRLINKQVDVAVLWEPDVSRALETKGVVKLLGTEDTNKLIVDVLIVNRKFSSERPEAVKTLLRNYFLTLKQFRDDKERFVAEAKKMTGLSKERTEKLLDGVEWQNLTDNAGKWFGVAGGSNSSEGLIDAIDGAIQILVDANDFSNNPIPNEDPYRITNSQFITNLYQKGGTVTQFGVARHQQMTTPSTSSLESVFSSLSDTQWDRLREIGTMKIRPIVFQSGIDQLSYEGKLELDKAVESLKHYQNFRVLVKGHTGLRGDKQANFRLSQQRADAVTRYLMVTYGINVNRLRAVGYGSSKPLPRKNGESSRAYSYRLPRVELVLATEDI